MTLDTDLLQQARTAEERAIDAERDLDVARAEFHRAVRRLQLAGGSMREIADALGISHQRVHQIVESAGGGRPWRSRKDRRALGRSETLMCCSFCGRHQKMVRKLIAGPGVYICDGCADVASEVISTQTSQAGVDPVGDEVKAAKCSFCGKHRHQVEGMAAAPKAVICAECLDLCHEIIHEELA